MAAKGGLEILLKARFPIAEDSDDLQHRGSGVIPTSRSAISAKFHVGVS